MTLDSAGVAGLRPMQALAFAHRRLHGDGRRPRAHEGPARTPRLEGLTWSPTARQEDPHRFTAVTMVFTMTGKVPPEPIQRAIDLSRDKYCSVWHSLRQDIPLDSHVQRRCRILDGEGASAARLLTLTTMSDGRVRRGYLDLLRGLAVLIMIEAHVLDAGRAFPIVRRASSRRPSSSADSAPRCFCFSRASRSCCRLDRNSGAPAIVDAASGAVVRRGLEIFGLAFLFRFQAWVLGWSSPRWLLRVDILNIMGPSIMAAAAMWGGVRTTAGRFAAFTAATLAVTLTTPIVRNISVALGAARSHRGVHPSGRRAQQLRLLSRGRHLSSPAASSGSCSTRCARRSRSGLPISASPSPAPEWRSAPTQLSFLPSPYPRSQFWTTSPTFFFIRVGIMVAAIAVAYLWQLRPGGTTKWSPMQQLGRTSLFIYWIHVEMVYGLISLPLHKRLSWTQSWIALALFSLFMLGCSILKDRWVESRERRQEVQETGGRSWRLAARS